MNNTASVGCKGMKRKRLTLWLYLVNRYHFDIEVIFLGSKQYFKKYSSEGSGVILQTHVTFFCN